MLFGSDLSQLKVVASIEKLQMVHFSCKRKDPKINDTCTARHVDIEREARGGDEQRNNVIRKCEGRCAS